MIDTRRELRSALGWFGSATLVMRGLDILSTVAILKFLTQEELGVASLAASVSIIAETLSGLGVAGSIVQAKSVSKEEQGSLFWWCIGVAVALGAVVAVASPVIARYYGSEILAPMVAASGLKFLTVGASIVPLQMLTRELDFKHVGIVQTVATMGEAVTKIALTVSGLGAWAIVIANVLRGAYLFLALMFVSPFRPSLRCRPEELRPFVSFGVRLAAGGLVSETYRNIDYFLIGRFLGIGTLGVYRVAFDLAMTPIEAIAQPIYRVTFPLFARVAHDKQQLVGVFFRSARYLLILTAPVAIVVFFAADDLLVLIKAERWLGAVPALGVLCWAALMRVSTRMFSNLFVATGRPDLALIDALLTLAVLAISMVAALSLYGDRWGMLAVCYAWLAAYPLLFGIFWRFGKLVAPLRLRDYWREQSRVVVGGFVAFALTAGVAHELVSGFHPLLRLVTVSVVTVSSYAGCLWALGLRWRDVKEASEVRSSS